MDTLNTSKPRGRKARSLQEEIAAGAAELWQRRKLEERQKEIERKALARNQKAVSELIAAHRLDGIPVEHWRQAIEEIKASLHRHSSESPHPVQPHA